MAGRPVLKPRRDGYKRPFNLTVLTLAHLLLPPTWLLLWRSFSFHTLHNDDRVHEGIDLGRSLSPRMLS